MSKLEELAYKVTGAGGEYINIDNLTAAYPEGVHVNGCFAAKTPSGELPAVTFEEEPNKYFYMKSGKLGEIWEMWLNFCGGDETKINRMLKEKPVHLKIWRAPTKRGFPYTNAKVIFDKTN